MNELLWISALYYKNTVSIKFFGLKGIFYLLLSAPFLALSFWLQLSLKSSFLPMLPMLVGVACWVQARNVYEKRLISHLTYFTHLESQNFREHKAEYLSFLTSHISDTLYSTMKVFKDIVETQKGNRSFVLDNGWYHFFKFLYDSDAKNRILSLVIYFVSLIVLLGIIKQDIKIDFFAFIQGLKVEDIVNNALISLFLILLSYAVIVVPLMFVISFFVVPLMLKMNSNAFLSSYLISELNKYAFLEKNSQISQK